MTRIDANTVYGTLNMLLLQTLKGEDRLHGLEIQRRLGDVTRNVLHIEEGALYPALRRLERDGLVASEWGVSEKRRRARFYRITGKGRRRLERERGGWLEHVRAVGRVLQLGAEDAP